MFKHISVTNYVVVPVWCCYSCVIVVIISEYSIDSCLLQASLVSDFVTQFSIIIHMVHGKVIC